MLDQQLERRINYLISDKVNFISGTMCPVDKNTAGTVLEDVEQGLNYYKENGVQNVVIQEKKMGNRVQVYLFQNVEDCYLVSRNGYKVKQIAPELLHPLYQQLIDRFREEFESNLYLRILDAELMPWRALGADLIDRSFYGFYELAKREEEFLVNNNFQTIADKCGIKFDPDKTLSDLAKFREQVELYGNDTQLELWPFAILKDVYKDESEHVYYSENNHDMFRQVNHRECYTIECTNIEAAKRIQNRLIIKRNAEGIVIKPDFNKEGVAPYLKCRNENYLKLIYGPDYQQPDKFQRLISRKKIKYKLRESIREYEIGIQMLKIPFHEIGSSEYKDLCYRFLTGQRLDLDPRL